ncbi:hypothetical protein F2P56_011970 [Juglans regia]|uniref:Myb-like domain-containing protein n=2 Tax=Juglans regia TaxID=51240 RepID=A0A834CWG6_JUGRE|nr:trihelix transcription factor GT-2-like isoform X2 [Juglans regia]KAF5467750.1 hypothetical protein F2P56_011970 [Juglans regia]
MMGGSDVLGSSGGEIREVVAGAHDDDDGDEGVVVGSNSGEEDHNKVNGGNHEGGESMSNCGGNRWPRQETLALLKIRSDIDVVFRDSNLKGPLWEEIARKLADLGYNRSAKKCKEKFENVCKYHKRTKEGRTGKPEGKAYRFFDQLQAFERQPSSSSTVGHPKPKAASSTSTTVSQITVPLKTNPTFISQSLNIAVFPTISNSTVSPAPVIEPAKFSAQTNNPRRRDPFQSTISANLFSRTSTSSSTESDQELKASYMRKRKWKGFFRRIAKEVIEKQEKLQQKFLEAIDKQENERTVREEAWRMQEMERINQEHEVLVRECSTAAANDAAIIAFLQKISGQSHPTQAHDDNNTVLSLTLLPRPLPPQLSNSSDLQKMGSFENISTPTSSSRWPKAEVQALIRIRKSLELKYQESGTKGQMWEDISAGMRRLGYIRSAKRCKEKWENINKYFKKVKDRNLKRREDSNTCPYFQQLDALYKDKNKINSSVVSTPPGRSVKPASSGLMEPLMVQPERQWRPIQEDIFNLPQSTAPDIYHDDHRENVEQNQEEDRDADDDSDEEEDQDGGGGYEMVINKPSLMENTE